jgi:hypothetical protein
MSEIYLQTFKTLKIIPNNNKFSNSHRKVLLQILTYILTQFHIASLLWNVSMMAVLIILSLSWRDLL